MKSLTSRKGPPALLWHRVGEGQHREPGAPHFPKTMLSFPACSRLLLDHPEQKVSQERESLRSFQESKHKESKAGSQDMGESERKMPLPGHTRLSKSLLTQDFPLLTRMLSSFVKAGKPRPTEDK